ncbi:MAG: helix-turn-helix domain-containing protein [Puniceicoccales bacterium]|jgi:transcriptional regulator with XRE-family HTH domain|nr:helix-turn-helix domain-containing protein [Puniceicoccales bacterium]
MKHKRIRDSSFGLRFRILLGYHNLTLRDISEATGAAVSTVSTWKNGRIPSSEKILEKIAKLFHVTKEYLTNGHNWDSYAERPVAKLNEIIKEIAGSEAKKCDKESLRAKIEKHFSEYLNRAETTRYGLEHTWIEITKRFPLSFFDDIPPGHDRLADEDEKF